MNDTITINYEVVEYIEKEYEIQTEKLHYCFWKGYNEEYNETGYLGIWTNENELKICEIINQNTLEIKSYRCKNIYTQERIKNFLRKYDDILEIDEEEFREKLNIILEKLK